MRIYFDGDTRALDRASKRAGKSVAGVGKAGLASAKNLARVGVAAVGIASVTGFAKSATSTTISLAKSTAGLARVTGMETEAASRWVNAAKVRGVEAKALNMGFISLSKNIVGATEKGSKQAKMFEELGVSQKAIQSGDTEAVLMGVSDAFAGMPDNAQKAALAQKLFGRQAQTLLPLINKGSDALNEQLALSDKYGTTMSQDQVDAALKAAAAQRELNLAMDGLRILFGTTVMPVFTNFIKGLTGFISQLRTGEGDVGKFGRQVVDVFKDIAGIVGPIATTVADGFAGLSDPLKKAAIAAGAFGAVFLLTGPVGLGIAAVVAGAVLIKRNWETIGPVFDQVAQVATSAFGSVKAWVADAIGNVKRWLDLGKGDLQQFGRAAVNFGKIVMGGLKIVAGAFKWAFETIALPIIKRVLPAIQQAIRGAMGVIGGIIKIFSGIFTGDFRKMWEGVKQLFSSYLRLVIGVFRAGTAPLRAVVAAMARGIWSAIRGVAGAVYSAGKWVLGRLIDAVKTYYTPAFTVGKFVANKVVDGIKAVSGAIAGAGRWVVSRVGDGISAAVSGLAKIGKTIANTIINAVKSALGIKSPSVVFQQIGKFMVQGLARGIRPGNVKNVLGKAFGGTSKFVKAMVKKGFSSVGALPGNLADMVGLGGNDKKSGSGKYYGPPANMRRLGDNAWVDSHTLAVGRYLSNKFGVTITDGWRPQNAGYGATNSSHKRGTPGNPGALDFAPPSAALQSFVGSSIAGISENDIHDWGTGLHNHVAFFARGGKVTSPAYVVGEEAPRFPEYILSTNPRDRSRSIGFWLEAARDLGISGFKKAGSTKKKTAKSVRKFNRLTERQDALDAAYTDPKYTVNLQARLKKIDQLLKLKKMSFEDRNALLSARGQIEQEIASAAEGSGETGGTDNSDLIAAIDSLNETNKALGEQQKAALDYAKAVSTATNSVTGNAMKDIASSQLGGWLAVNLLTLSPKVQIA